MEDSFKNFTSVIEAQDADFTKLAIINRNLSTQARHQQDHFWYLQAQLCNLKVAAATRTTDVKWSNITLQLYTFKKKQKLQWPTHPTEKIYNNINYCWYHGYDTSKMHTSDTFTSTMVVHKKEATWCNPIEVSHNEKSCEWKKGWNRGRGDYQKHIKLNYNGIGYNNLKNIYVCRNLARAPSTKTHTRNKKGKFRSLWFRLHI